MHFIKHLNKAGDHPLLLEGEMGCIEAVLTVPEHINTNFVAFLGHPHSLQGGTMNNKVVTTLARLFKELNIPSLRFNFRGVGLSAGSYDQGIGESRDMLALVGEWLQEQADINCIFAGFSFGSYVAYRAAAQRQHALLITIAPPVHHYNYREYSNPPNPWLIVQGDADEVVPYDQVLQFAQESSPQIPLIELADTGHFFHGKLIELKTSIKDYIQLQLGSL